jgi:2,5-dihydroxypyridine 5,6-dioxygenase
MSVSDTELFEAWKQVLSLSKVTEGEMVTILTSADTDLRNLVAARLAATVLGACVTVIDLPPVNARLSLSRDKAAYIGKTSLEGNLSALAALKASDLVIDLMYLLFSKEQGEILGSGTRILLASEPPEILTRIIPTLDDKRRVTAAQSRIDRAKTMVVTSDAGTNIQFELGQYKAIAEYGFADAPGRWDHWPSGFVLTWPTEGGSTGTIILDRGDIIYPFKEYLRDPIELVVKAGYVTRIDGGFDAQYLKSYIEYFEDPEAYAISHIGWGLQRKAQWTTMGLYNKEASSGQDGRSFYGNFLFSLGPNTEAGGSRDTPCHLDIPMRNCSVGLDGEPMTVKGVVIPEDQKAEGVHVTLAPESLDHR